MICSRLLEIGKYQNRQQHRNVSSPGFTLIGGKTFIYSVNIMEEIHFWEAKWESCHSLLGYAFGGKHNLKGDKSGVIGKGEVKLTVDK